MPIGLQIGLFIRYYGMDAWRNPGYSTEDRIVPIKLFGFLSATMLRNMKYELVEQIQAITLGGAQVMGGKGVKKIHRMVDQIYNEGMGRKPWR